MQNLSEKISYLVGMSHGLNLTETGPQGRIVAEMVDVLSKMAEELKTLKEDLAEFKEYVECMDDDLLELEEDIYGEEEGYLVVKCRKCKQEVCFDQDILEDDDIIEVICPNCNEVVYVNDGSFELETKPNERF